MQNLDIIPRPKALFEAIADSLRDRILTHELPPGTPIDECAVARELGVSRTPVREALKVLARDGLVTVEHRRTNNCTVTEYSPLELAALLRLIEYLEIFQCEWNDNRFVPELVQRVTDKLYLAVGPGFFSADMEAKKEFRSYTTKASGRDGRPGGLANYFAWRRLEVAKRSMTTTTSS